MKPNLFNLNHTQQIMLTGALGLLSTAIGVFKERPTVWTLAAYESMVVSGMAVAWTLLPKEPEKIEEEGVSSTQDRIIPIFKMED